AEFMAAVLTNQGGFYSTMAYVEESRRMGLRILLPDIRKGELAFTAEDSRSIRIGLMQVKDVAAKNWDTFFEEREKKPWIDFADFLLRTHFGEGELEALIKCGACDSFELNRPQLLWLMKAMFSSVVSERSARTQTLPLYDRILRVPKIPHLRDYSEN